MRNGIEEWNTVYQFLAWMIEVSITNYTHIYDNQKKTAVI